MLLDKHNIYICDSIDNINKFIDYIDIFDKSNNEKIIGIDFEFNNSGPPLNKREIALFQINLHIFDGDKNVFMFYPPDLSTEQLNKLKHILYSNKIIIHGGESLDIPYIFSNIFTSNKDRIRFLKNLYDTRFMCEYYNIINNVDYKCKIYELLKNMKVIDSKKYNYLIQNEQEMGPIYKVIIDVKNMNDKVIIYSAYDVIFLPDLYKKFPTDNYYQTIIPGITRNVLIMKYNGDLVKNLELLNKMNLFFINIQDIVFKFIDLYQIMIENIYIGDLLKINYFRKFLFMIIKYHLYKIFVNNYKTYYKKNKLNKLKINNDIFIVDELKQFNNELYKYIYNQWK
jgi:hypothetical protein